MAAPVIITPPAEEPLTLDEAKAQCRVDHQDDDDLITGFIASARISFERRTNRSLITRTLRLDLDRFPHHRGQLRLPMGPVRAVTGITYHDTNGSVVTLDPATYTVDITSDVATITPVVTACWPWTYVRPAALSVTYTAGFGGAEDVPADIKSALKLMISDLYDNGGRESAMAVANIIDDNHIAHLA